MQVLEGQSNFAGAEKLYATVLRSQGVPPDMQSAARRALARCCSPLLAVPALPAQQQITTAEKLYTTVLHSQGVAPDVQAAAKLTLARCCLGDLD